VRICLFIFLSLIAVSSFAQKKGKKEKSFLTDDQRWTIEIPLWIPGFRGAFSYGDISMEGEDGVLPIIPDDPSQLPEEIDKGNIFSRLFSNNSSIRFFFVSRVAYQSKRFLVQADGIGGSIGSSVKFRYNNRELVESSINVSLARVYVGYKILEKVNKSEKLRLQLYGYAGTRLYFFRIKSSLANTGYSIDVRPVWADPLFGLQLQVDLKNWQFIIGSDLGGFNINNRISYSNQVIVYYRISRLISVRAGWLDMDIKHRNTVLNKELRWQTHLSGPSLGIGFHF